MCIIIINNNKSSRTSEMDLQVKILGTKPDDLNYIFRPQKVEGED